MEVLNKDWVGPDYFGLGSGSGFYLALGLFGGLGAYVGNKMWLGILLYKQKLRSLAKYPVLS
jgi:hypothetical protein